MHRKALNHLRGADPKLARVIERVGRCELEPRADGTHFDAVMRAIIYQQLSGKAAATILRRTLGIYGDRNPTPAELLATPDENLRGVGLSRQKISYLKDLALKVHTGVVPMESFHELPDDEVVAALTAIKGVGRWTAQMFLMFRLGRPNVLPVGDLGIQKAIKKSHGLRKMPSPERVQRIGAKWAPHSTIACWYLWRSLDAKPPD